jgi:hypothetical protein
VSRLDSAIRRLAAQRACLDRAAELVAGLNGVVLELGLGNGRTFDHLREVLPGREIYVFELQVAAHPDCIPDDDHLILGDVREMLTVMRPRFAGQVALAHIDLASGDEAGSERLASGIPLLLSPLMRPGGIIVSERELPHSAWGPVALPADVPPGRYRIYRSETCEREKFSIFDNA